MEDRPSPPFVRNFRLAVAALLLTGVVLLLPPGLRPLWPAVVALLLVFATRIAVLSLATASLCALILLAVHENEAFRAWFGPNGGLLGTVMSPWHYGALIFTLLLGAFAAVVERSGGLLPLLRADGEVNDRTRKRFLTSVFGLGLVCFFDGLANALMIGRVARPVADRLRIPRAFLAYLVDTTSSAVACVAFLSTWIVTQLSLIESHSPLADPAYRQFLTSIPHNFYCLFALVLAFLALRRAWMIGPMRTRVPSEPEETDHKQESSDGRLSRALVPLLVLLLSIPIAILLLHTPEDPAEAFSVRVQDALNANSVPSAFMIGSALALLAAMVCFPRKRFGEAPRAALMGARQLLPALGLLLLAWILGSLFSSLGTAKVLSDLLGSKLPLVALPAGVFALGCTISFVSGTSWGTMGILMPLVLPLAGAMATNQAASPELLAAVVPAVIGAVFGGAVFGDHCSPYSDTTIVSALASGVTTAEHTITQLPYALLTAGVALLAGYLPVALGLSPWIGLLLGCTLLSALVVTLGRRV